MACPTCGHTMQTLYHDRTLTRWWCQRCGTIKNRLIASDGIADEAAEVPVLVERCRRMEEQLIVLTEGAGDANDCRLEFERLGIAEAINAPDLRPKGPDHAKEDVRNDADGAQRVPQGTGP
jgi:hypothetical protein